MVKEKGKEIKMDYTSVKIHFVDKVLVAHDAISHKQKLYSVGGSYCNTTHDKPQAIVRVSTKDLTRDQIVKTLLHELLHVCYVEPAFCLFKPEIKSELSHLANKFGIDADIWRQAAKYKEIYQIEEFYIRTTVELIQRKALPFPRFSLLRTFLRKYLRDNMKSQTKRGKKYINLALNTLCSAGNGER